MGREAAHLHFIPGGSDREGEPGTVASFKSVRLRRPSLFDSQFSLFTDALNGL